MRLVHVWLIKAKSDVRLFDDVCDMLRSLAERHGGRLEPTVEESGLAGEGQHYFGQISGAEAEERISREVGIHRAQIVPKVSKTGRVETALVGVEWLLPGEAPRSARGDESVLKTYNYLDGSVMHHPSGHRLVLDAVLRGEV